MIYEYNTYDIDRKIWSITTFENKKKVIEFVEEQYKYPGKYELQDTTGVWNEQAEFFRKEGSYPVYTNKSIDFRKHWDFEKSKCKFDSFIIYKSKKKNYTQILPSLYYWYLNYCPIYNKHKKKRDFVDIWDGDLHTYMALLKCILKGEHFVCLKKRQFGMSFKLTSVLLNVVWFSQSAKAKLFSYNITHTDNSWEFLEQYRDHLLKYSGWKRGFDPNKIKDWQVRRKKNDGTYVGNMSILKGLSTERDASKPVGGGITVMFGEEAGINPNLDVTHGYVLPAVGIGSTTTGLVMYSGSVGELDKCEPLKKFMFNPEKNGFLSFPNVCDGDEELGVNVGFFVPEWWNYMYKNEETEEVEKCFDKWGNTNEFQAKELIRIDREKAKEKDPADYRQYISQRPLSITEAFAHRKESIFPQDLLGRQEYRILEKKLYPYTMHDIERDEDGNPKLVEAKNLPIEKFPFTPKKDIIPYGCIKIWHKPEKNPDKYRYFAAVDPIAVDKTTSSDSLFSIVIYEGLTYQDNTIDTVDSKTGLTTQTTDRELIGDRIVASYVGRKKDRKTTNELAELLIEYYNAYTIVENNVDNFNQHMIRNKKTKYLATKGDLTFLKEMNTNVEVYKDYGVHTNPRMWTTYKERIIEFLKEDLGVEKKSDGEVLRTIRGVERIPDMRLIKELQGFTDEKGNYDQIITLALVLLLAKTYQTNGVIAKKKAEDKKEERKELLVNRGYKPRMRNAFRKRR